MIFVNIAPNTQEFINSVLRFLRKLILRFLNNSIFITDSFRGLEWALRTMKMKNKKWETLTTKIPDENLYQIYVKYKYDFDK